jgi:hypothetical protein
MIAPERGQGRPPEKLVPHRPAAPSACGMLTAEERYEGLRRPDSRRDGFH